MNGQPVIENQFDEWEVINNTTSFMNIEDKLLQDTEDNFYEKVKLKI